MVSCALKGPILPFSGERRHTLIDTSIETLQRVLKKGLASFYARKAASSARARAGFAARRRRPWRPEWQFPQELLRETPPKPSGNSCECLYYELPKALNVFLLGFLGSHSGLRVSDGCRQQLIPAHSCCLEGFDHHKLRGYSKPSTILLKSQSSTSIVTLLFSFELLLSTPTSFEVSLILALKALATFLAILFAARMLLKK